MQIATWQALQQPFTHQSELLACLIDEADAIVIGIGAGMSASDGFTYIGERFTSQFPDFIKKYKWLDMLQASLDTFDNWLEYWAFQSRFIALNYLDQPVGASYVALNQLLQGRQYHIITTNADNAFDAAGFDRETVFHIQGEYGLMQCSQHCHPQTYRDDALIRKMIVEQKHLEIPYELLPLCPKCNAPLEVNKRNAEKGMVEDNDFHEQLARYNAFLEANQHSKVLYIEIGVGYTTPQFIKQPFHQLTKANTNALFVVLNQKKYRIPQEIQSRSVQFDEDIARLLIDTQRILNQVNQS